MTAKTAARKGRPGRARRPAARVEDRLEPAVVYLDASALVKLLLPEAESESLNRALAGRERVLVSDLAVTEATSALARRRREGALSPAVAIAAHRKVLELLGKGSARGASLDPVVHREAERLLLSTDTVSLRAADALHLALALSSGATVMATYDTRLAAAAAQAGMLDLRADRPYS